MNFPKENIPENWARYYGRITNHKDYFVTCDDVLPAISKVITQQSEIIDIGCGSSKFGSDLYENGYKNITCVDSCMEVVDQMQIRVPDIQYMHASLEDLHLPSNLFNCAILKAVLDFMDMNVESMLKGIDQCYLILKKNGVLILITSLPNSLIKRLLDYNKWANVYSSDLAVNNGCQSLAGISDTVSLYLCFK